VTAFVSDVRSRFPGADDEIDQAEAERIVRKALGRGPISDIDGPAIRRTQAPRRLKAAATTSEQ
jgi:hypothetical protein